MTTLRHQLLADTEYQDVQIAAVQPGDSGWELTRADGWIFWCPRNESGIVPTSGQTARFYGAGIGYTVRGLALDGRVVFYQTAAEHQATMQRQREEREAGERRAFEETGKTQLDVDYAGLPVAFQRRIDRFRAGNPDFRWQYEAYEMVCCVDAVRIAETLRSVDAIDAFKALPYAEQRTRVPELNDGHSGNTFGCACHLAKCYLTDRRLVEFEHGALTALVGCQDYGCTHPTAAVAQ